MTGEAKASTARAAGWMAGWLLMMTAIAAVNDK